jgi:hypothetical protein
MFFSQTVHDNSTILPHSRPILFPFHPFDRNYDFEPIPLILMSTASLPQTINQHSILRHLSGSCKPPNKYAESSNVIHCTSCCMYSQFNMLIQLNCFQCKLNLGCLHPVACVSSGDSGFLSV